MAPASESKAADTSSDLRHARSGDVSIAYQVVGEGALDIILVHGWVCTFQPGWESPAMASFYRRLAGMGRLILFDKRGTGLSDHVPDEEIPDLETRMDDVLAVMDAAESQRAVLVGVSEGGPMSVLLAATYPERVAALVLLGTFARTMWASDYPIGLTPAEADRREAALKTDDWARQATAEWLGRVAPAGLSDDDLAWYVSYIERGATRGAALAFRRLNREIDVRHVLPTVGVPTLVAYRADEHFSERTKLVGAAIAGSHVVALPGSDHLPWEGDRDALLDEIERYLAGLREAAALDRVLATVLFLDIVGSTTTALALGDRAWRDLLERHNSLVRAQLVRYRGREIGTAGDGMLAAFDGPARAVRCALAIVEGVRELGLEVRAGLHTGEVEIVGSDLRGIAVHIGARIAAKAGPGEVLVSRTVTDLVAGSGLQFEDRGPNVLAGVPGEWQLLAVVA